MAARLRHEEKGYKEPKKHERLIEAVAVTHKSVQQECKIAHHRPYPNAAGQSILGAIAAPRLLKDYREDHEVHDESQDPRFNQQ